MSNLLFKTIMKRESAIQLPFHWVMDHLVIPFCSTPTDMTYLEGSLIFKRKGPSRIEMLSCQSDNDKGTEEDNDAQLIHHTEDDASWSDVIHLKKIVHVVAWMMMGSACFAETVHMSMNPDKRITADISKDSMNRVAITGDRITQVFGDSEAYELQTEETSGQIFIKPIIENGEKPLSLTLITEKNITQDLLLQPCEKEAATVILKSTYKGTDKEKEDFGERGPASLHHPYTPFSDSSHRRSDSPYPATYQDTLLDAMKRMTAEQGPVLQETHNPIRLVPKDHQEAVTISFKSAVHLGSFKGYAFEVKNITETPIELREDHFFQQGDLVISLDKHTLKIQEVTTLYVVMGC